MTVSNGVKDRLKWLCVTFLEPIRAHIDAPIAITSGYRPPALNKAIGGSRTSFHMLGMAVDFIAVGYTIPQLHAKVRSALADVQFAHDQLILEHSWVHLGAMPPGRGQVFTL